MTGAQDSYLHTLARKAGEDVEENLTKAEASMKIDELRPRPASPIHRQSRSDVQGSRPPLRWLCSND